MDFGKKLKKLLNDKDMSQTDLSKLTDIKQSVINGWIKGHSNNPKFSTLEKLAEALNVSVNYFTDNKNTEKADSPAESYKDMNMNMKLIIDLIEKQNKIIEEKEKNFEEKMKRYETENSLLKKEIELIKNKIQ